MTGARVFAVALGAVLASLVTPAGAAVAAPPSIDAEWVTDVTSRDATLNAEINPNGLTTYYELQIDTTGNFKFFQFTSCPLEEAPMWCLQAIFPGDPLPPGLVQPPEFVLPASYESQHVSVNMASIGAVLQPGATYYYRAIAANGEVLVEGPTQTFTTPPAAAPPTIDRQWVTDLTPSDATLHAEINPNGMLTKYKLQIDTTGNFKFFQPDSCPLHPPGWGCAQVIIPGDPLPSGLVQPPEFELPTGYGDREVSVNMASIGATLEPGMTYYYRAIAANSQPVLVEGATQTFTAPTVVGPPPPEGEPEPEPPVDPPAVVVDPEPEAKPPAEPTEAEPVSPAPPTDVGRIPPVAAPRNKGQARRHRSRSGRHGSRKRAHGCARKTRRGGGHRRARRPGVRSNRRATTRRRCARRERSRSASRARIASRTALGR